MPSPTIAPPEGDRRKTNRTPFEPLRARLGGNREGICVDLSEGGARLQLSIAPPQDQPFAVELEWRDITVTLQARVVRSVQRYVQVESATLARLEHYVSVEFMEPAPETSTALRRILRTG